MRVVHYVNQFFGQIGAEDKASTPPLSKPGPVGPGRLLNDLLKGQAEVVGTVICGDTYFADHPNEAESEVLSLIEAFEPHVVVAGPAFLAGRYGSACGTVCQATKSKLGIPVITGMHEDNPAVDLFRREICIVKTVDTARGMAPALTKMAELALKMANGEALGGPQEEGYFGTGLKRNTLVDRNAADRGIEMILAKLKGEPYSTEIAPPKVEKVPPARHLDDLASATLALVTDGGLVVRGNPEKIEAGKATRYCRIDVEGIESLTPEAFEVVHYGYDTTYVNEDPNRVVPLDAMRSMEKSGAFARLHPLIYSTSGATTPLENARRIGVGIAADLLAAKVSGAILTST